MRKILFLGSLFTASLSAMSTPGCFTSAVELLYFKPSIEQSYFVISCTNNVVPGYPIGPRYNDDPDYDPGFRLETLYEFCNGYQAVDFRFTWFSENHKESVSGPFLYDAIGFAGNGAADESQLYTGTASLGEKFTYYALDATFNRYTLGWCPDDFSFLIGLHFAHIELDTDFLSTGLLRGTESVSNKLNNESKFWGIGPQLGLDYRYSFPWIWGCRCGELAFIANARAALLSSRTDCSSLYVTNITGPYGIYLKNKPLWRITPGADIKLGASYTSALFCMFMTLELGYEFIWYGDVIDSIVGYDVALPGLTLDDFSNLSLQGPYLALKCTY